MSFPESKKTAQHENIFSEMLAVDSKIARNSIISDLEIISTIIIDGDFAKNDCDDIWALAYLIKNIGKVNGDKPLPRLICGSLNGAVNMQSVISSDTNIDKETSGFVKTRRIRGLTGNVIIYILGGVDDDEVVSYEDLMTNNTGAIKLCFIFQSPPIWNHTDANKAPSNVRSGYDELDHAKSAVKCFFLLLKKINACNNAIAVFTDFERTKRVYTIKYPYATSVSESTMIIGPSVFQNSNRDDQDKQDLLHNYIDSLSTTYKDYHNLVDNYEKPNPNIKFNMAISSVDGTLIKYGSFIADLYTVYASLGNNTNIIYKSISDIEYLEEV
jgi:hypothetical protein